MIISLRRTLVATLVVAALSAAVIGVAAAAPVTSEAPLGAAPAAVTLAADAGPADAGAADSGAIAGELDAILAAERAAAPDGQRRAGRGELRRLAAWRRLVHATIVVDLPEKGLTTVQLDRGTVSAVSADSLSIAEAGGTSVTIKLGAETRVRKDGKKAAVADLKVGDEVFAMSLVEGSSSEAYLVVVPRPRD